MRTENALKPEAVDSIQSNPRSAFSISFPPHAAQAVLGEAFYDFPAVKRGQAKTLFNFYLLEEVGASL